MFFAPAIIFAAVALRVALALSHFLFTDSDDGNTYQQQGRTSF